MKNSLTNSPLSADALRQAAWYAAAFGATAGLATSADAQVVYNDIEDVTVQDTYVADGVNPVSGIGFDLDGDGDDEIVFGEADGGTYTVSLLNTDDPADDEDNDVVSAVIGRPVDYGGTDYAYFAPLEAGYVIPDDVGLNNDLLTEFNVATFTFGGSNPLSFEFGADQYIGFQFTLDTGTMHNAWMRIELIEGGGIIVKDYAFNATPEASIEVGEMGSVANEDDLAVQGYSVRSVGANPFSVSGTKLQVEVAQAEQVRAEVYNALGQRVEILHNGALAGQKTLQFGSAYAPGLYVVRVTGETFQQTLKVTRR